MSGTAPSLGGGSFGAPLPEVLSELVERVVRGPWLWPSEKRDVRAELESHFREGLYELAQEGKSMDESVARLRDEFGDPSLAARLIRRGKKRGRPMYWKVFVSAAVIAVLALGAGAGYVTYVTFGKPTPTVDYVARINEPIHAIPEEDRAWPLLREVALDMQPGLEQIGSHVTPWPKPGESGWDELMQFVIAARPYVPRIVQSASRPSFGYVYGKEGAEYLRRRAAVVKHEIDSAPIADGDQGDPLVPPTISLLLPHLTDMRAIAKFLALNAREHMMRGEFEAAWKSIDAAHRLATHLLGGHTLIEQLVGAQIIKLATEEMRSTLFQVRDTITTEQIALARASHIMTAPPEAIRPNLKGEQFFFEDVVQYVFTDDGNGNGRLIPSQFAKVCAYGMASPPSSTQESDVSKDAHFIGLATVHADRRETLIKYYDLLDRAVEFWSLPLYDARRADGDALIQHMKDDPTDSRRFALVTTLMPALSRADRNIREAAMSRLATQTVIALLSFKAEHSALPQRLVEITPRYLPQLPTDAFSGMLLRYATTPDGSARLYSVGRNFSDDGGSSEKTAESGRPDSLMPADLVFWPPN